MTGTAHDRLRVKTRWTPKTEELTTSVITAHRPDEDPDGLAVRCSCDGWAMLHRNIFGLDATTAHGRHVAECVLAVLVDVLLPPEEQG